MKLKHIILFILFILLTGCADGVSFDTALSMGPVGFWHGFWHGFIIIFSWIGSLFSDDIAIYAIYNNGGWYDLGFILGIGMHIYVKKG